MMFSRCSDIPSVSVGLCAKPIVPFPYLVKIQDQGFVCHKPDARSCYEFDAGQGLHLA